MSSSTRLGFGLLVVLGLAVVAFGQGQQGQSRALLELRLRSPLPAERTAALRDLKLRPQPDLLRAILLLWHKDANADVRISAADCLYGWRADAKLRQTFLTVLKREYADGNAILAGAWLAGAKSEEHPELLDALARVFEKRPAAAQGLVPVADFLATREDADSARALAALTRLAVYQKNFGFRRSVVQGLTAARRPEAVSTLVELLADSDGEIQGDIAQYLTRISGKQHALDWKAWKNWWATEQSGFEFPAPNAAILKARQLLGSSTPTYYGIPIFAKKVIFVMDTSGSMQGKQLANAKAELIKTVESLPAATQFNIVCYSSTLEAWQRGLQMASPERKTRATAWVNGQTADGATFTYDAVRAALDQQPEAIYLLTDGKPTGGTVVEPNAIIEAIKQSNRYRRTTIHVIGLAPGPEKGPFSKFLEELAAQNWGQYRRVD